MGERRNDTRHADRPVPWARGGASLADVDKPAAALLEEALRQQQDAAKTEAERLGAMVSVNALAARANAHQNNRCRGHWLANWGGLRLSGACAVLVVFFVGSSGVSAAMGGWLVPLTDRILGPVVAPVVTPLVKAMRRKQMRRQAMRNESKAERRTKSAALRARSAPLLAILDNPRPDAPADPDGRHPKTGTQPPPWCASRTSATQGSGRGRAPDGQRGRPGRGRPRRSRANRSCADPFEAWRRRGGAGGLNGARGLRTALAGGHLALEAQRLKVDAFIAMASLGPGAGCVAKVVAIASRTVRSRRSRRAWVRGVVRRTKLEAGGMQGSPGETGRSCL